MEPQSAALEAHLSRLRAQAEERDYQRMVKDVDQQVCVVLCVLATVVFVLVELCRGPGTEHLSLD